MTENKLLVGIFVLGTAWMCGCAKDPGTGSQSSGGAAGNTSASGGSTGRGGSGGSTSASGGSSGTGGAPASGGASSAGGTTTSGGSSGTGGSSAATGGSSSSGGKSGTGGNGSGGIGSGGTTAKGGSGGNGSGGSTGTGGGTGLPALTVNGTKLQDPNGKTIVLRGSSLIDIGELYVEGSNSVKGITDRMDKLATAGVQGHVVRFPVYPKIDYNGGYPYCSNLPYPVGTGPTTSCSAKSPMTAADYVSKVLKPAVDYATSKN
jgi:hypothetical protein